jgi:hypothetical protein
MNLLKFGIMIIASSLTISTTLLLLMSFYPSQAQSTGGISISQSNTVNLAISNITLGDSPTGLISINGVVFNNSTESVDNIKVEITLYDANNNTIRDTSRFISSAFYIFEPGSTVNFDFLMSTGDFNYYTARAYGDRIQ